MKKFLRFPIVILCALLVCVSLPLVSNAAESRSQFGIEMTIGTEQDEYASGDEFEVTVDVTNNTTLTIENADIEAELPKELKLTDGELSKSNIDLEPGETYTLTFHAKLKNYLILWLSIGLLVALTIAAIVILLLKFKKKPAQMISAVLCITSALAMLPLNAFASNKSASRMEVEKTVIIGKEECTITADVRFPDADMDGLPNYLEEYLGTSPVLFDTDADGIGDYVEMLVIGSNPIIADSELDSDLDGLSNLDEVNKYKTDPASADTDLDSLTDYNELNTHGTDPLKADSDGDLISDGDEIMLSLDPLTKSDITGVVQNLEKDSIQDTLLSDNDAIPSVSGKADAVINGSVTLSESASDALGDNRAIVGKGVDLDIDCSASLDLSFKLSKENESCVIMRLDDENGWVLEETRQSESTLSATVTQSGTYCVMDLDVLLPSLGVDVDAYYNELMNKSSVAAKSSEGNVTAAKKEVSVAGNKVMGQADIVFVIDTTGSMASEIYNVANNVISFTQTLNEIYNVNVNYALVEYRDITVDGTDSTKIVKNGSSNWFADIPDYADAVSNLIVDGGGDYDETVIDALETARDLDFRSSANKFIIVVTDAEYKTDNNYGITSMQEEIELLKNNGIIVSVVTTELNKGTYQSLYEITGGIYANIYGDFAHELLALADMIGASVNEGNWILLDDFQYVALDEPYSSSSCDSDSDGKKDIDELKSPVEMELTDLVKKLLSVKKVPQALIDEYFTSGDNRVNITVYPYISNPVLPDTDFDGISDMNDSKPKSNSFKGEWKASKYTVDDAEYSFDFREFFGNKYSYNQNLCEMSLMFSALVYGGQGYTYDDGVIYETEGKNAKVANKITSSKSIKELLDVHFDDVVDYNLSDDYSDDDLSEVALGNYTVSYNGMTKQIVAVVIRGTNSTEEEWSSNFNMGNRAGDEWENENNHRGFDITSKRIEKKIDEYVKANVDGLDVVYWVAGHSRGAGIANIVASDLINEGENVFAYTFATPNTTVSSNANSSVYASIFNVVNDDDFVPRLPLSKWDFKRYGRTATIDMTPGMENEWHDYCGNFWYNQCSNATMNDLILAFEGVSDDWDSCYTYTCSCHGDGTDNNITQSLGMSYKMSDRAKRYCEITKNTNVIGITTYKNCQTPAYFMQILAEVMSTDGLWAKAGTLIMKYELSAKYRAMLLPLISATAGGLNDPHYCETYAVITNHLSVGDFR